MANSHAGTPQAPFTFGGVPVPVLQTAKVRCGVVYADNASGGTLNAEVDAVTAELCPTAP